MIVIDILQKIVEFAGCWAIWFVIRGLHQTYKQHQFTKSPYKFKLVNTITVATDFINSNQSSNISVQKCESDTDWEIYVYIPTTLTNKFVGRLSEYGVIALANEIIHYD